MNEKDEDKVIYDIINPIQAYDEDKDYEPKILFTREQIIEKAKVRKEELKQYVAEGNKPKVWIQFYTEADNDEKLIFAYKNEHSDSDFDFDDNEVEYINEYKMDYASVIDWKVIGEINNIDEFIQQLFCFIDEDGWHAANQSCWYIRDNDTEESKQFDNYLKQYLTNEDNKDKFIAILDCHIQYCTNKKYVV